MEGLDAVSADPNPLLVGQSGERIWRVRVGPSGAIGAHDDPLRRSVALRWIDDIFIQPVGPREAAENVVVLLPEARGFERQLHAAQLASSTGDRGFLCWRKVVGQPLQDWDRQGTDAIIRFGDLVARAVLDSDPIPVPAYRSYHGPKMHRRLHSLVYGVRNPIHAADGLKHRRLHVPDMFEDIRKTDGPRRREFLESQRREGNRRLVIATSLDGIAG